MIEQDEAYTRVIFRVFREGGEVIAFFPDLEEVRGLCSSYMHVGQHGAANYHALTSGPWPARTPTRPAMPDEYAPLAAELIIGTAGIIVPPAHQGQVIEVGYTRCATGLLRVTRDLSEPVDSDAHATVEYASDDAMVGAYQPQNEPPVADSWRILSRAELRRIMED